MNTRQDAPLLPGMPRPSFGGVQLRPGLTPRRPYTGPQLGLFETARPDPTELMDMLDSAESAREQGEE